MKGTVENDQAAPERRRILVVDDEPQITRVLRTALSSHGYDIHAAADGDEALEVMREWTPDLIITDLAMPNMEGLELCRSAGQIARPDHYSFGSRRRKDENRSPRRLGADDYVTKPFAPNELLARVRAMLRRAGMPPIARELTKIEIGDFSIDLETHRVAVRGRDIHLSPKEFDLVVYWAKHPSKVITHRALLSAVWGRYSYRPSRPPPRLCEPLAEKIGTGGGIASLHHHGTVGGLPLRTRRLTFCSILGDK